MVMRITPAWIGHMAALLSLGSTLYPILEPGPALIVLGTG
jgi:hypothetical protein